MKTKLFLLAGFIALGLSDSASRPLQLGTAIVTDTIADDDENVCDCWPDDEWIEDCPTEPLEIKHFIKEIHEDVWYNVEAKIWHRIAKERKTDENAWLNYFRAKRYEIFQTGEQGDSLFSSIVEELGRYIPDSYTYYCAAYQLLPNQSQEENRHYAEEAIKRMPAQKTFYDYDTWLDYYNLIGDSLRLRPHAKAYLESGLYSSELLTYTKNLLNTLPQNALCLADGDANIIPIWLIQEGIGQHRDKLFICHSHLFNDDYVQHLFTQLGLGEAPKHQIPFKDYDQFLDYVKTTIEEIVRRTGRPLYLTKNMDDSNYHRWDDNLYDEGMAYHYSLEKIDMYEALRKNYEQHCDLNYLLRPLPDDCWRTDRNMSLQQYHNFNVLLPYYLEKNDKKHFKTLRRQLISAGMRYGYTKKEMKEKIKILIEDSYAMDDPEEE